jgi:hypothetical protein
MLTRDSVLHYWSSRYGINPRVGGRPVFTRNSAGLFTTQEGEVDTAIVNTPRFDWATLNLPNSLTERRKVLTLEQARTNLALYSAAPASYFSPRSGTLTAASARAPDGTLTAALFAPSVSSSYCGASPSIGNDVNGRTFTVSFYLRCPTGSKTVNIGMLKNGDGGVNISATIVIDSVWRKYTVTGTGNVSSTTFFAYFQSVNDTTSFLVWGCQVEENSSGSALIPTTSGTAARATDSCYWDFPPVPQAMMAYMRFVEQGTALLGGGAQVLVIGPQTNIILMFAINAISGGAYNVHHNPGSDVNSMLAAAPALGDTVELLGILFADGSVQAVQSLNGAAVTFAAQSGAMALEAAWADPKTLGLNSIGSGFVGSNKFAEVKIVKYADVVASTAQGRVDELRAFELGPNADVL